MAFLYCHISVRRDIEVRALRSLLPIEKSARYHVGRYVAWNCIPHRTAVDKVLRHSSLSYARLFRGGHRDHEYYPTPLPSSHRAGDDHDNRLWDVGVVRRLEEIWRLIGNRTFRKCPPIYLIH